MRSLVASIAVHALVVWWLAAGDDAPVEPAPVTRPSHEATRAAPIEIDVELLGGGGSTSNGGTATSSAGTSGSSRARVTSTVRRARAHDAWEELTIRHERNAGGDGAASGAGAGTGGGHGGGHGRGIGFGTGGGIAVQRGVPRPPVPAAVVSKARPATLIWPTRDREVEDEDDLFIARVTVDEDGDVVGARMVKTRPGSRGEHAANAIWQFRYLPALDDRGVPTRSTFDQPFQIR